ncbi:MAG: DUF1570 domain-containing protein [Lentisphaeria bacterium]|nr:DUF1570 domain-containing protein [Lentisphaeria bacterium]
MNFREGWIVVVGDWEKTRAHTDLRHETAHQALCALTPDRFPPFWLSEGIATLFESGADDNGRPKPNPPRRRNAARLVGWRRRIRLSGLIDRHRPAYINADAYARSWALTIHLAQNNPHALRHFLKVWQSKNLSPGETFVQTVLADTQLEQLEQAVSTTMR